MPSEKQINDLLKSLLLSLLLLVLAACGSGGGTTSSSDRVNIAVSSASSGSVTVTNTALQISEATTVTANLKNPNGTPAVGVPVNFTTTLGSLTPSSGVATTDLSGNASVMLTAGVSSGQGQVIATATVANRVVNLSTLFSVVLPPLKLANLTLTDNVSGSIDYGSSQGISVEIQDAAGNPFTSQSVNVSFTSTQATMGKATINSPVSSVNGRATTTYTGITATGTDVITASIAGSTQTINLTVNPLTAGSITFVSAQPASIGLKGMGGVGTQETSRLTFKVLDTSGAVRPNQPVSFSLNTNVGGITLSSPTGSTGPDGTVSVTVQAGVVATPVRVTASTTVGSTTLSTQSDVLTISTGVAAQDGFSVALSNLNPEAYNVDGVAVSVTARLSDHFHNPVPDGTAVSFTTSGGSITPSCTTSGGSCTVTWTSQDPRPLATSGALANGRAVILAYAIGEEFFLDLNGNGVADPTDNFVDTTEAFRDDNENRTRQASETFIDFNQNTAFNGPDGFYNGVLQGAAYSTAPKSKHVFSNTVLVMSTSAANIVFSGDTDSNGDGVLEEGSITGPGAFSITVTDENGNTMPSGTTIAVSVPFGTLTGASNFTVAQNTGFGVTLPLHIAASTPPAAKSGLVTVTVTSPGGLITARFISISGAF